MGQVMEIEELTAGQQALLDALVREFGLKHGRFGLELKVVNGVWEEARVNPERRVLRKCLGRSRG